MTVTSQRSATTDIIRSAVVAVLAVVQVVISGIGGIGGAGDSVGDVARDYPTPLLAAGWAFAIWGLIYTGFLAYAVYQLLPAQRRRAVHRETGWWMAASAVFNAGWILSFAARWLPLAEVMIIGLLVTLAVVFGKLSRTPATDVVERVVLRGTVAVYTGWVSVATVLGTAATGVWAGLPGEGALATVAAVVVLLIAAAIVGWVVISGTAVVGYAAAVIWALAGIALNDRPVAVTGVAVLAIVVTLAALARRVSSSGNRARAAFG
ncbi:TspO/MBR family protein [Pseudonocardia lacus]|uniref:TspO/MBR family protein n=1 Tax=Pseudonocardia lacus TaxID=2835865 RepID=UPI001BDD830C|nr:TspO/MBR family protein [Pseudonocardia lacus]